jgi:hypothetical protein
MDGNKKLANWEFEPLDISEVMKGLNEGLSVKEIAVRVCCPLEALENGLDKIGIGGGRYGSDKVERRRKVSSGKPTKARKDVCRRPG